MTEQTKVCRCGHGINDHQSKSWQERGEKFYREVCTQCPCANYWEKGGFADSMIESFLPRTPSSGSPSAQQEIEKLVESLRKAINFAYSGSATAGSFLRPGRGEFVPSPHMVIEQLAAALRQPPPALPASVEELTRWVLERMAGFKQPHAIDRSYVRALISAVQQPLLAEIERLKATIQSQVELRALAEDCAESAEADLAALRASVSAQTGEKEDHNAGAHGGREAPFHAEAPQLSHAVPKYTNDACPHCGSPRAVVDGRWLRERRELAGLTLREMGRRAGFSAPYLSDVEWNRRNRLPAIVKAYEAL